MACEPDGVAGALANDLSDNVLVELILKTLGGQDSGQGHSSLGACFKENGSALVLLQNHL